MVKETLAMEIGKAFRFDLYAQDVHEAYIKALLSREVERVRLRGELLDVMGVSGDRKEEAQRILKLLSL